MNLDNILPLVSRPSRYIDGELNSFKPKENPTARICLCFPDIYEIGASGLGIEILYHLINDKTDASAERCYCPDTDMEQKLRESKLPLFALESKRPLKEFDIIGFTLQYELCSTNVLNILDLAGLPVLSKDRGDVFPLIIGGGPMTANPEPLADFFDAFVLGEGEEAIIEILEKVGRWKKEDGSKKQILLELAQIPGVYVPSLYDVEYNSDNTVKSVRPNESNVPERVQKRATKIEKAFFPAKKIVPFMQTVHERLNVEIARGCPRRCRFCQATRYYSPWRIRPVEEVLNIIDEGINATGYEEISLSSLSCTDYKDLEKLLNEIIKRYASRRISISLPSLRCNRFSIITATQLSYNKRSSLTFAPEAGTARLRAVIGKDISEQDIRDVLLLANRLGWQLIKLYFMVGLPTETDADTEGIIRLVKSIKQKTPRLNFNITVSPFIPKAQTPFQWSPMAGEDVVKSRIARLRKGLPASVKSHKPDGTVLEAVLARGDRRLAKSIITAWKKGCKFDQWGERLRFDLWKEAFAESGIDMNFYTSRERSKEEILPWEHLEFGTDKNKLWEEYQEGLAAGAAAENSAEEPAIPELDVPYIQAPAQLSTQTTIQRVRICFARKGYTRFISHLEQIEVFRRLLRRSTLPMTFTSGFHPQPKMAFGPPNSVGYESETEYIEVELSRRFSSEEVKMAVSKALPEGFEIVSVRNVPVMFPSFESLVNLALYEIKLDVPKDMLDKFLSQPEIIIEKIKKDGVQRINAKPLIKQIICENGTTRLMLRFAPKGNLKADKIIQSMLGLSEDQTKQLHINRKALYAEKADGTINEF